MAFDADIFQVAGGDTLHQGGSRVVSACRRRVLGPGRADSSPVETAALG
jgi:hypothetical protein